jgi:protein gp37
MGTTAENQARWDQRKRDFLAIPASVLFLSCEPLLSDIALWPSCFRLKQGKRMWVIAGGESGPKARPMNIEWARSIRHQCATAGVPFFMKQLGGLTKHRGELEDFPEDLRVRDFPKAEEVAA